MLLMTNHSSYIHNLLLNTRLDLLFDKQLFNKSKEYYKKKWGVSDTSYDIAHSIFEKYCKNYVLNIDQLGKVLEELKSRGLCAGVKEFDLSSAFALADTNGNQTLDFEEFISSYKLFTAQKSDIKETLKTFIRSRSNSHHNAGNLNTDEIFNYLKYLDSFFGISESLSKEQVKQKFGIAPVSYDAFVDKIVADYTQNFTIPVSTRMPTNRNDGSEVSKDERQELLNLVKNAFGGYTLIGPSLGAWVADDGVTYEENAYTLEVLVPARRLDEVREIFKEIGRRLGQLAIYFEIRQSGEIINI